MKKAWKLIGRCLFWLGLPFLHVYLKIGTRTRVLLLSGNKALVVKGWLNDGRWSLPGGGLHTGEDPKDGILRELLEETGVILSKDKLKSLGMGEQRQHALQFRYHRFFVNLSSVPVTKKSRFEIVDIDWVDIGSLDEKNAQQHVIDTLKAWRKTR